MMAEPSNTSERSQADSRLQAGLEAFEQCRWHDAVACFREVVAQDPDQPEVAEKLAFALSQAREYDQAIEVLRRLCEKQPKLAKWPYMIGYQFYVQSAWGEAIDWFDRALALRPTYVKVLYRKAYALHKLERHDECVNTLHSCLEAWQQLSPNRQQAERKIYGKANSLLGKAYLAQGFRLKAKRPLQIAIEADPDDPDRRYELGKCFLENRQPEDAIRELKKANALRPGKDYVLDRLAQAYAQTGNLQEAEALYSRIPKHRRRPFVLKNLGELYLKQERADAALEVLQEAAKRDRANHNIQYLLGKALEATGGYGAATRAYEAAISLKRQNYGRDFPDAQGSLQRLRDEVALQREPPLQPSADPASDEETGTITFYNDSKGFGFIQSRDQKIFFHVSSLDAGHRPAQGANVAFCVEQSARGLRAIRVRLLSG